MKKIGSTEFHENFLEILEELDEVGLIITKDGVPLARLVPYDPKWAALNGSLKDKISVHGDIFSTGIRWDAES